MVQLDLVSIVQLIVGIIIIFVVVYGTEGF